MNSRDPDMKHFFHSLLGPIVVVLLVYGSAHAQIREAAKDGAKQEMLYNEIREIVKIRGMTHPALGWTSVELGDLNDDGYDDYAISSFMDTTFVYFGGDPIPLEAVTFVLGGTAGLRAGDVNGDGRIDLVTSRNLGQKNDPDPENTGRIRIYLNTGQYPFFQGDPDQTLEGDGKNGDLIFLGVGDHGDNYMGIDLVDMNGDAKLDLLAATYSLDVKELKYALFLGPYPFSGTPDVLISPPQRGIRNDVYSYYLTGDVNGDGCDDLLIQNVWVINDTMGVWAWDMMLGNSELDFSTPAFTLRDDTGWYFNKYYPCITDVNDDGFDDIIEVDNDGYYQGNVTFWHGRKDIPDVVTPDDSLINPEPKILYYCRSANPVGDLNGDGTRDLMIAWVTDFFPESSTFFLYANRSDGSGRHAFGSASEDGEISHVDVSRIYPIGDVNGDGFDDVILLGRPTRRNETGLSNGFRIYGGNAKLVSVDDQKLDSPKWRMQVYPNPAPHSARSVRLAVTGEPDTRMHVRLVDNAGKLVCEQEVESHTDFTEIELPLRDIPAGAYHIQLCEKNTILESRTLLVQ
jgi:hypothetical protein